MAKIEIRYFTGDVEQREINKTQPVSIGRQASNDVCVDEDDVGPLHCRIAWNRSGYEIVAAQPAGVVVNGTSVQHAVLADGDVIRVGTIDIALLLDGDDAARAARVPAAKPLPDDLFEDDEPAEALPVAAVAPSSSQPEGEPRRKWRRRAPARPDFDDAVQTKVADSPSPAPSRPPSRLLYVAMSVLGVVLIASGLFAGGSAVVAVFAAIQNLLLLLFLAGFWRTFEKAGQPGWGAFVPVYNVVLILRIAQKPRSWLIPLVLLPVLPVIILVLSLLAVALSSTLFTLGVVLLSIAYLASIVVSLLVNLAIAERFEEGAGFGVGLALLPFVFYPILGFGSARYVNRERRRLRAGAARPGEQPILQSPLLISLLVGMAVLALTAGVFWVWTKLNAAEKEFLRAEALHKEQKYKQAIDVYSAFLKKYSRNRYTDDVFFGRAKARVEQHITGSTPNWQLGLDAAKEFRKENRNREGYAEQEATLNGYAVKIALGACKSAERLRDRKYLPIAEDARNFVRQLSATDEFESEFTKAFRRAEDAVVRQEHFKQAEAGIKAALASSDIPAALQHRLDFLQFLLKYDPPTPLRDEDRVLSRLLTQTMETERSLIKFAELNRPAEANDRPERSRPARSLAYHSRPNDGLTSDRSQVVVGLAKGCCYGVDAVTGAPLWRRAVGLGRPFFPVSVDVRAPSLLMFDTHFGELLLVERLTGKLVWRQPLRDAANAPEQVSGPPLVHAGQIYLPTLQNNLYQLDLDSGRIKSRLTFSQPVLAPPVVAPDGARLVLAGDKAVVYTIQMNPKLACLRVDYVGHRSGSVRAPLMRIGKLVLMCENDFINSCRLRVLNTSGNGTWLDELTFSEPGKQIRVPGQVLDKPKPAIKDKDKPVKDQPVIRQNKLFVSSSGERVTVFVVSDDTARPQAERNRFQFLRPLAHFEDKSTHSGPVYIVAGPNDQVWMASTRLRKFQLMTKVIVREDEETAFGRATQPPQEIGQNIYLGRQTDSSTAVYLTQHDRVAMDKGRWRVDLGSSIIAWNASANSNFVACINEEGNVFRVTPGELAAGGFSTEPVFSRRPLEVRNPVEPIRAATLPDGRFVVAANGTEQSAIWLVDGIQTEQRVISRPRQRVETQPMPLGNGLILPLAGRLKYVSLSGGFGYEDYQAPFVKGQDPPRWTHLAALSKTEFVALDSKGRLRRIQLRAAGGRRHLGMAVERLLPNPPGYGFAAHGGRIVLADNAGNLEILNPATLQPAATLKTGGTVSNSPWVLGDRLYVETGFKKLLCYQIAGGLQKAWELPLTGESGLAGPPAMIGKSLVVAERDGTLLFVNPADGKATATQRLGQPISGTPKLFGATLLVPTIDGSLYSFKVGG
jgi:outer membrane protein assembly factor BamB